MNAGRSRLTEGIEHERPVAVPVPQGGCKTPVIARTVAFALVDPLEQYVRSGLELAGEEVDEVDVAVIRAADRAYGPAMRALDAADLVDVLPEPDLDPARAPRPL
jgi:hypothetical protein